MTPSLRGRSLAELATRIRQRASIVLDRTGIVGATRLPGDKEFLRALGATDPDLLPALFRSGPGVGVFQALADPKRTSAIAAKRWPDRAEEVVERAKRIRSGRFDLLGLRDLSFGDPLNWHLDPTSDREAPMVHWSVVDRLGSETVGDRKVIWELSRHQYFLTLCRAWLLTGEAEYAELVVSHIVEWMDENPPNFGINWSSSLELAYRTIAWLWALTILCGRYPVPNRVLLGTLKHLWLHGKHVEAHLSTYFSPNTHLTGEALGLLYLGTFLPAFPEAQRWKTVGWKTLVSQLDPQVESDGTYFERASYYHRYTVDIYTHSLILGRAIGASAGDLALMEGRLSSLLGHLCHLTRPDGTTPLIGDDDGGHLWFPDPDRPTDFRGSLSNGAALFGRPDLAFVAGGPAEETLWLLGEAGLGDYDSLSPSPPKRKGIGFKKGGLFVLRDSWEPAGSMMVLDVGPHGVLNCGHAHADALSFDLSVRGRPVFVDPGTVSYADEEVRNAFRSTGSHNTATVNGTGSSEPGGLFQWKRSTDAYLRAWRMGRRFDHIVGEHTGFESVSPPGIHRREVTFARGFGWLIRDGLFVGAGQKAALNFQLAAGLEVEEAKGGCSIWGSGENPILHVFHFLLESETKSISTMVSEGAVSDAYARSHSAPRWRVEVDGTPTEILTLLVSGPDRRPQITAKRVGSGLLLSFQDQGRNHSLWNGQGEMAEGDQWETDARMFWHLRDVGGKEEALFASNVARLRIDESVVVDRNTGLESEEWVLAEGTWGVRTEEDA